MRSTLTQETNIEVLRAEEDQESCSIAIQLEFRDYFQSRVLTPDCCGTYLTEFDVIFVFNDPAVFYTRATLIINPTHNYVSVPLCTCVRVFVCNYHSISYTFHVLLR